MEINKLREVGRKIAHLFSLLYIAIYVIVNQNFGHVYAISTFVIILIAFLILEFFRVKLRKKIPLVYWMWREDEKDKLGAQIYTALGAIIVFAVFDFNIAVTALLMMIFGDFTAGMISMFFGKHKLIIPHKTWEGVIAQFIVNIIIGIIFIDALVVALAMAFTATAVETIPTRINDNLTIPVASGFVGWLLINLI